MSGSRRALRFEIIAVRDRLQTAEDADRVASMITEGLWNRFELRERQT
jgi:hypothetical protein